jgi:FkbM family methyltransferase
MAVVQSKKTRNGGPPVSGVNLLLGIILLVSAWITILQNYEPESTKVSLLDLGSPSDAAAASSEAISASSFTDARWDEGRWKPVDCAFFMKEVQQGHIVEDPNNGQLMAKYTQENAVPFWINVHNGKYDAPRLAVWETGKYYEQSLSAVFSKILDAAPANARVIDVGGNIGWFSMLSAAHGHHVDVFEPNKVNILRQCQSKWLNGWPTASEGEIVSRKVKKSSLNIRAYGVSDQEKETGTMYFGGNPGMGSFVNTKEFVPANRNVTQLSDIPMIMLDSMATELGWLKNPIRIAILKIDIEGFEPPTVKGALKLLSSGMVENMLMEMTSRWDNTENQQMLSSIVDAGFVLFMIGKSNGPTSTDVPETNAELPEKMMKKCASKPRQQCNFWWKHKTLDGIK